MITSKVNEGRVDATPNDAGTYVLLKAEQYKYGRFSLDHQQVRVVLTVAQACDLARRLEVAIAVVEGRS